MSIFEEISDWILKIRLAIEKKAVSKQPSVTYNDKERDECIFLNQASFEVLRLIKEQGSISEATYELRDGLANLYEYFVNALFYDPQMMIQGKKAERIENHLLIDKFDVLKSVIDVRNCLEVGVDTRVMFFPVFDDDRETEEELNDLKRLTLNGLVKNVKLFPFFCYGAERKKEGIEELDPLLWQTDPQDFYDQFYTVGECAVLYAAKPVPDVIAMLIRSDADFTVRTKQDPKGMHAFIKLFQKDFIASTEYKKLVLTAYKDVYQNQHNKLSDEQRASIPALMMKCIRRGSKYAENVSEEDKQMIKETMKEMLTPQPQLLQCGHSSNSFEK